MQRKQLVTRLGHKTHRTSNSHKASVHMYPTDDYSDNTTQQTCTKPLLLSIACLYQTDGPYFATGPHTLPTKLNIYTHHTHVLHLFIPQILLKCLSIIYKKNGQCLFTGLDYSTHPKWWFSKELGWTNTLSYTEKGWKRQFAPLACWRNFTGVSRGLRSRAY